MKKLFKSRAVVFLMSLLFLGGVALTAASSSTTSVNASDSLTESSFMKVNPNHNNDYDATNHFYATMLQYDVGFADQSLPNQNVVSADSDVGNKMLYNGTPVKDIPGFFVSYYVGGTGGKMLWFKVPEDKITPSNGYTYSTLFIPKGMQMHNAVTKQDVSVRLIDGKWHASFGSDVTFLNSGVSGVTAYDMTTGYELLDSTAAGYSESSKLVLKLGEAATTVGMTANFVSQNISISSINSISFKVKFDYTTNVTGSEFRVTNDAGKSWILRYNIGNAVSGTWYTVTLNPDKTITSDIPGGTSVECSGFTKLGDTLGIFNVGARIKPDGNKMSLSIGDIIVETKTKTKTSFVQVNPNHNNDYDATNHFYATMLEYDVGFADQSLPNANLVSDSSDVGKKMLYNGTPVKDVPGFFVSYYVGGSGGKMLWFKIPEANINPTGNYRYSTVFIPKGMEIYDTVTNEDITVRLIDGKWAASFGSDVTYLTSSVSGVSAYSIYGTSSLEKPSNVNYLDGDGLVLKLPLAPLSIGGVGVTLDLSPKDVYVSGLNSVTFKVRFDYENDVTGSEFRITNDGGVSWILRYNIGNAVSGTWYSITLNSDKTVTSDIPGGSLIECSSFTKLGSSLGKINVGIRIKGASGASIGFCLGDVSIDAVSKETASFTKVNIYNNNNYLEALGSYSTMLEFDKKFDEVDRATVNIATSAYDLGSKMLFNGTAIKDIPGFFAAYYYAADVSTPMLWFRVPEAYIEPVDGSLYSTLYIPAGTEIYNLKVDSDVSLSLMNGKWAKSLVENSFLDVNIYNNNNYNEDENVYSSMLHFEKKFCEENVVGINLAVASEDLGNKMTLNGVAIKDIPGFFASYYDSGSSGPMIWFKVPASYIEPSNGYTDTTLFIPKGTIIYETVVKSDVKLYLNFGKWVTTIKWSENTEPLDEYDYSFAIVGDTQDINYNAKDDYHKIYDWIVDNKDSKKIAYTIGLGDITEKDLDEEWSRARDSFDDLEDAGMNHIQVRGNHDSTTKFNNFFMDDDYYKDNVTTYGNNILNHYSKFRVGNNDYLVLALDYGPSDDALEWANQVVEDNEDYNVIVVTHGYLYRDGTRLGIGDELNPSSSATDNINNGDEIWDKFVKKHENIVMVLSGHIHCENVLVNEAIGEKGNKVTEVLIDPQQMDRSGTKTGMVAMFYFSNGGKNIQIQYYSTILELYEVTSPKTKITTDIKESILTPEREADEAAKEFLKAITCDGGVTSPNVTKWNAFASKYAELSNEAKAIFANATPSESGSNVEKAVARYTYIVSKYNTASKVVYQEFITGIKVSYLNVGQTPSIGSNNTIMVYALVSIALFGIIGFSLHKKKTNI